MGTYKKKNRETIVLQPNLFSPKKKIIFFSSTKLGWGTIVFVVFFLYVPIIPPFDHYCGFSFVLVFLLKIRSYVHIGTFLQNFWFDQKMTSDQKKKKNSHVWFLVRNNSRRGLFFIWLHYSPLWPSINFNLS